MADQLELPYPPQAIASAKKMGNGVLYMLESMDDEGVLDSTWGGNLADMVRFCQELKIVRDERLIEQVPAKAAHVGLVDRIFTRIGASDDLARGKARSWWKCSRPRTSFRRRRNGAC